MLQAAGWRENDPAHLAVLQASSIARVAGVHRRAIAGCILANYKKACIHQCAVNLCRSLLQCPCWARERMLNITNTRYWKCYTYQAFARKYLILIFLGANQNPLLLNRGFEERPAAFLRVLTWDAQTFLLWDSVDIYKWGYCTRVPCLVTTAITALHVVNFWIEYYYCCL